VRARHVCVDGCVRKRARVRACVRACAFLPAKLYRGISAVSSLGFLVSSCCFPLYRNHMLMTNILILIFIYIALQVEIKFPLYKCVWGYCDKSVVTARKEFPSTFWGVPDGIWTWVLLEQADIPDWYWLLVFAKWEDKMTIVSDLILTLIPQLAGRPEDPQKYRRVSRVFKVTLNLSEAWIMWMQNWWFLINQHCFDTHVEPGCRFSPRISMQDLIMLLNKAGQNATVTW